MDLIFLDASFNPISAPADDYTSCVWTPAYYQHGTFSAELPVSRWGTARIAAYLYNAETGDCGIINSRQVSTPAGYVTIGGYTLEALLDRRVLFANTKLSGNVETAVREFVTSNALSAPRTVQGLNMGDLRGFSEILDTEAQAGERLSDALYAALKPFGMSYAITLDYLNGIAYFTLRKGLDRTQGQTTNTWATFSRSFENLQGCDYSYDDAEYTNFAIVTAEDDTYGVVTVEVDQTGSGERREIFISSSASSKRDDDTTMTKAQFQAMLASIGAEALAENAPAERVAGTVGEGRLVYGTHYNVGDLCDVMADDIGLSWEARITSADIVYEGGAKRIVPYFGEDEVLNIKKIIAREVKRRGI